jgi:predicted alpha/beta hydrolase
VPTEQAVEPREHGIPAADGRDLAATTFPGSTDEVVVIAGATGVPRRVYADLAAYAAGRGPTAITFDYRGMGGSAVGHPRDEPARKRDWGQLDIEGVLRHVADRRPSRILWIGQSAGGAYLPLAASRGLVDRLVTVSVMSGYWRLMAPGERRKLGIAWHTLFPLLTRVLGYGPSWMWAGEPLPPGVLREWGRWCRMPGYFFDDPTVDTTGFADLAAPVLAVRAADDVWATEAAHRTLHAHLAAAEVTYRDVAPEELGVERIGHIDLLRQRVGAPLWPELLDWLLDVTPPAGG